MTPLQQAARNIILRWDSPLWKYQTHTAEYVNALRVALEAEFEPPSTQPAAPVMGERAELIKRLRSTAYQDDEVRAHAREAAEMLEADAREIEATERQVEILSDELSKCSKAQQVAVPATDGEIYTAYITAASQTLRPQDERIALAFARAIEAHHGIKEKLDHKPDWSAA